MKCAVMSKQIESVETGGAVSQWLHYFLHLYRIEKCAVGVGPTIQYSDTRGHGQAIAEEKKQKELQQTFEAVVEEVNALMECEKASLWMVDYDREAIYTKVRSKI